MSVLEIAANEFSEVIKNSDQAFVVEFWIRSCPNCQKFKPIYAKLPERFTKKVTFFQMNMFQSLENLRLAEGLGVEDTPTLKIFCKGKEVGEIVGYRPLDQAIEEIEGIFEREKCCRKQGEV